MAQALTVDVDRDQVVLAFPRRGDRLPLDVKWDRAGLPADVDMAVRFAAALEDAAAAAADWVRAGGARAVVGGGRRVGTAVDFPRIMVVFDRPAATHRLPFEAARALASEVHARRVEVFAEVQRRAGVEWKENNPDPRR